VTPMVLAFWDQSKHVEDRRRSPARGNAHPADRVGIPAVANL
jgi:hypothetical protein